MKHALIIFLSFFFLFCSCKKKCPQPTSVVLENNGPVVEGWDLHLSTTICPDCLYRWYGPNGWKKEFQVYSSSANLEDREKLTLQDGGEYKVQLVNADGCVEYEGKATVNVIPAPNPPCSVVSNTSTSSVVGVGNYNFIHKNYLSGGTVYYVSAQESTSGDAMKFTFYGGSKPLPGIHKTSPFGDKYGEANLFIQTPSGQFSAIPDQNVYVNLKNGKLEISFCNLRFNNPLNPSSPIFISANLREP